MARTRRAPKRNRLIARTFKVLITGIFVLALAYLACQRVSFFVKKAGIFQVREIIVAPELQFIDPKFFNSLRGRSIFDIRLKEVQQRLKTIYPQMDQMQIIRKLPDTITILAKRRDPLVMFIQDHKEIVLDQEGVVVTAGLPPAMNYPLLTGLSGYKGIVPGAALRDRRVQIAIKIVKSFQARPAVARFQIASLEVSNLSRIEVVFTEGLKVIMDPERTGFKVDQLEVVLSQKDLDLSMVEYIDLRFKEPILGKKSGQGSKP